MMGGEVGIESAPGIGTTVSATLTLGVPVSQAAPAAAPQPQSPLVPFVTQAAVLVVDDHPINRRLLVRQLAALGLERVTALETAPEALNLWRAGGIALVITDCNMPMMDGLMLARTMREIEARDGLPRTPIIGWTANVLAEAALACRDAGMDHVLTKPADLSVLKHVLSTWLPGWLAAAR
jgi:two-component system, NarL family, sensor histidine kinase EvgS